MAAFLPAFLHFPNYAYFARESAECTRPTKGTAVIGIGGVTPIRYCKSNCRYARASLLHLLSAVPILYSSAHCVLT